MGLLCGELTKGDEMKTDFTRQDLDVLFEAVESWEKEDHGPGFMGHMLTGMLGDKSPEAAAKLEAEMDQRQKEADAKKRKRKERGVMLRAKLITLRDQVDASEFVDSVS